MTGAGFWTRFFAFTIDQIILQAVTWLAVSPVLFVIGSLFSSVGIGDGFGAYGTTAATSLFVVQFLYFGFFWSNDGQSLGKKVLGIKVVCQDGSGLTFMQAGLRGSFGYWLSGAIVSIGFIWAAFDENGETWHDKLYRTRVVSA